jgi:hypothetical protein
VVDPTATPVDGALASIGWDAGDNSNIGRLDFKFSILLRPTSKSFSGLIETPAGTPLGGNLTVTLNSDGTGTFAGEMHDSGFPSYNFSVRAVVRSASGTVTVVAQKSGEVKRTDSGAVSGDDPARTFSWNEASVLECAKVLFGATSALGPWPSANRTNCPASSVH